MVSRWVPVGVVVSAIAYACASSDGAGGTGGVGGAGGSAGAGVACGAAGGTLADLSGTWQFTGSRLSGPPMTGSITIGPQTFAVVLASGSLHATADATGFGVVYDDGTTKRMRAVREVPGSLSLGAVPIDLSGSWQIAPDPDTGGYGCSDALGAGSLSASCSGVRAPAWFPHIAGGTAGCTRTSALPSMFGDLGGTWSCSGNAGGQCTFTFSGNTVQSSCTGASLANGNMEITFDGATASGTTSLGIEFSACRL